MLPVQSHLEWNTRAKERHRWDWSIQSLAAARAGAGNEIQIRHFQNCSKVQEVNSGAEER